MMKTQNYVMSSGGLLWTPLTLDDDGNLKASIKNSALPTGAATEATIASILAKLIAAPSTAANQATIISALTDIKGYVDGLEGFSDGIEGLLTALNGYVDGLEGYNDGLEAGFATLNGKDFATQTTLASILAKIIAAPATEAKQDALNAKDFATQTTLASILAKIIASPATEAKQDTLNAKDFATQTTLAAILAKLIAAPATEAKQDTQKTVLDNILTQLGTTGLKKLIDPLPAGANILGKIGIDQTTPGTTNGVAITSSIESVVAAPVVGAKTVTSIAAEIFAGSSVKANRRKLIIRNEDPVLRLRIGPSSVTQQNGFPIEPGATVGIRFDPATAVAVYARSEGAALSVAVMEV